MINLHVSEGYLTGKRLKVRFVQIHLQGLTDFLFINLNGVEKLFKLSFAEAVGACCTAFKISSFFLKVSILECLIGIKFYDGCAHIPGYFGI